MQPIEVARLVAKYWPKDQWVTAVAVAGGESDWDEKSHYVNPSTGDDSYGLLQINMRADLGPDRRARWHLASNDALFDPAVNIRCAWDIYVGAGGWSPWGAYTDGGYKKYGRYEKAQAAVAALGGKMAYQIQHPVIWKGPVPNQSGGFQRPAHGVVLHIMDGTLDGTDSWFHNPSAQASSDYGVGKDGRIYQWVNWETDWKAWAEGSGNPYWVSIENEGHTGEALTQPQLVSNAQIVAHVFSLDNVPFVATDDPNGRGLGWHGMGGAAWGGHDSCLPLDSTEVLTPAGWRMLSDVGMMTAVASWDADSGIIEFAKPLDIIAPYATDVIEIAGLEMTPDHRLYVHRTDGDYHKVLSAQEASEVRTNWVIPAAGAIASAGCGIGPDLMRLLVWVQADAHYSVGKTSRIESLDWHLAKQRKIDRIRQVLADLDWPCTLHQQGNGTWRLRAYGQERIERNVLRWLPEKQWGWWLLNADAAEFDAFNGEVFQADGFSRDDMQTYSSAIEKNADIVQALYITHGKRASKHSQATAWVVQVAVARNCFALRDTYRESRRDVMVGCLTTQNGTLLIRQNGRAAIVGNCPGEPIKAQRPAILSLAKELAGQGGGFLMALTDEQQKEIYAAVKQILDENHQVFTNQNKLTLEKLDQVLQLLTQKSP